MHAAKDDHLGVCLRRLLRETERIAHVIRHVLDFRHLIIVGEDDRVQFLFERANFARQSVRVRGRFRFPNREPVHRCGLNFGDVTHKRRLLRGI